MKRKILVTGASGFVGSCLLKTLLEKGYEVTALDSKPGAEFPGGVEGVVVDLGNPETFSSLAKDWWGVIHLAAISVPNQFTTIDPILANLRMTMNLLEHLGSARVLLVSSCHVYAPSVSRLEEEDRVIPQGRYGLSKHLCEQLVPSYRNKLDIRIVRPFNHVGPGMDPRLMIPTMVRRVMGHPIGDTSPVIMEGTNSIRDFIDVRDVVSGYLTILELEDPVFRTFNVCTGRGVSVEEIVQEALRLVGASRKVEFRGSLGNLDDSPCIVGCPDRLHQVSGWRAVHTLPESIRALGQLVNLS